MPNSHRTLRSCLCACVCAFLPAAGAWAGLLSGEGVFVLDTGGSPRQTFTKTERLSLQQRVHNGAPSNDRIRFKFLIFDPAMGQVFLHEGNSAPGRVGTAASSLGGLKIEDFYRSPGIYTLKAVATLDASSVEQQALFTVSSPNVTLLYPPSGMRGVSEKPLTFRWLASGAVKYRVSVSNNPSFYQPLLVTETTGGESSLPYPDCPGAGDRSCLSAGTVYYWKVEGLDGSGNVLAESATPFDFSLAEPSSQTRDLALKSLDVLGKDGDKLTFRVTVENRGSTAEMGVPLKFSLGGVPAADSPLSLSSLQPGQSFTHDFAAPLPADQGQSLAIACVELFDSDVPNNCKTLQITRASSSGLTPVLEPDRVMTTEEVCAQLLLLLQEVPNSGVTPDTTCSELQPPMTRAEMQAMLSQLRSGQAGIVKETSEYQAGTGGTGTGETGTGGSGPITGPGPVAQQDEQLTTDEACAELKKVLDSQGYRLDGFDCTDLNPPPTRKELSAMLAALLGGKAEVALSGPSSDAGAGSGYGPGGTGDQYGSTPWTKAPEQAQAQPEVQVEKPAEPEHPYEEKKPAEVAEGEGLEWSGIAVPLADAASYVNIRSSREWKRLWKRLSDQRVPKVDFGKLMVVGVAAGGAEHAERAEVLDVREVPAGLRVQFRVAPRQEEFPEGARDTQAPYHLKVVAKSDLKLLFEKAPEAAEVKPSAGGKGARGKRSRGAKGRRRDPTKKSQER